MKIRLLIIIAFGILSFSGIDSAIPVADGHDVQLQPANNLIIIENETFDLESMQTGETLTAQGTLINIADRDIRGWVSIFSESDSANNRWEILARDPPDTVFVVPKNSAVEYSLSAKALEPGTYHVHTVFGIDKVGPVFGPGQTIVVQGEPIIKPIPFTHIAYQLIPIVIGSTIVIAIAYYFWRRK